MLGFAVLPLTQALLVYSAFPLLWQFLGHASLRPVNPDQTALAMAITTGLFGVLVTICGAIPVVFWLMGIQRTSFHALVSAGAVLGNAPFAFYVLALVLPATIVHLRFGTMSEHIIPVADLMVSTLRIVVLGSSLGAISAAVLWLIAFND
jgi:hypothetical protein